MQTEPAGNSGRGRLVRVVAISLALVVLGITAWALLRRPAAVVANLPEVPREAVVREKGLLVLKDHHQPFTGRLFENHADGSRKLEIEVRGGRLDGRSRGWYAGGQLENEETFHADFSEGPRIRWFSNGTKKSVAGIRHGKLVGLYTEWHDNGQKAVVMMMKDGKADGVVEAWHTTGALKSRTTLDHGRVVSQKFFDDPATAQAKTE